MSTSSAAPVAVAVEKQEYVDRKRTDKSDSDVSSIKHNTVIPMITVVDAVAVPLSAIDQLDAARKELIQTKFVGSRFLEKGTGSLIYDTTLTKDPANIFSWDMKLNASLEVLLYIKPRSKTSKLDIVAIYKKSVFQCVGSPLYSYMPNELESKNAFKLIQFTDMYKKDGLPSLMVGRPLYASVSSVSPQSPIAPIVAPVPTPTPTPVPTPPHVPKGGNWSNDSIAGVFMGCKACALLSCQCISKNKENPTHLTREGVNIFMFIPSVFDKETWTRRGGSDTFYGGPLGDVCFPIPCVAIGCCFLAIKILPDIT